MQLSNTRRNFFLWILFSIIISFVSSLFVLGSAHAQGRRASCGESSMSSKSSMSSMKTCGFDNKGVVCNQWTTLVEEDAEEGFPTAGWDSYNWIPTNCTSSEGENSLWCSDQITPCSGLHHSYGVSAYAGHETVDIPQDCDLLKISFDYHYRIYEGNGEDEWLGLYLNWPSGQW